MRFYIITAFFAFLSIKCNTETSESKKISEKEIEAIKLDLSIAAKNKDERKVEDISKLILNSDSTDFDALRNLGVIEQSKKNYNQSISFFKRARHHKNNDEINMHLGTAYALKGNDDSAIYFLLKAFELKPMLTYIMLASEHLRERGQFQKAVEVADVGLKTYPNDSKLYGHKAGYLASLGKFDEALTNYNLSEKGYKEHEVYAGRAFTLANLGKFQEALMDINKAIGLNSNIATYYNWRGQILYGLNNLEEAIKDFEKAAKMGDPEAKDNYEKLSKKLNKNNVI